MSSVTKDFTRESKEASGRGRGRPTSGLPRVFQYSVALHAATWEQMAEIADARGMSVSAVIREACANYITEQG